MAKHWYKKEIQKYILYGFGMGYHVSELLAAAAEAEIEIYEADSNVLQLACAFADVKDILSKPQIKLIFDPKLELLQQRVAALGQEEIFIVHYPSYKNLRYQEGKAVLETALPWCRTIEAC